MLHPECQNCQEPKKIHLTQIVGGKVKQLDLCEACPHAKGISDPAGFDLLGELLPGEKEVVASHEILFQLECRVCGCTTAEFRKTGRFGCSECYKTFFDIIQTFLSDMHRGTRHIGKWPKNARNRLKLLDEISQLEQEILEAVESEHFEVAARIRDKIKTLKIRTSGFKN